ncbi:zinc finger CCHC domain-containing protein 7-like isoform X1 [Solea senegalensis]|uniref:Zinc finger CCHC domain-containing protein 7 n=1 Tax=Solea senegalensis TaxID=28829 RepID=A0AAV6SML7_SOLSE|nr:zinc finger CCHC domain-containing protein 7-like isoform X1 [Solea senegalensis]KAG7518799.1 zinc finger CCHC domain-containing protein 7-like isoform X1 [Solea senegalensis]
MDIIKVEKDGDREEATYVESYCSSDDGDGPINSIDQKHQISCKQAPQLSRDNSPPLLLAFSITRGRALQDSSPSSTSSPAFSQEEDCEQPVEDWMILGGEEQEGDSSIQLNLGYWSSSEDESVVKDPVMKTFTDTWAVLEKDKCGPNRSLTSRYFMPGRDVICNICNRTGHGAKSCYYQKQKYPTCVLCGIKGHIQRDCPSRPCPSCGLPSHGLRPCEKPPVWNQLCWRCGMTGHLSDTCPDTWRQYHKTIRLEVPLRPQRTHTLKYKRCFAHCYNCSKRGHYGFECTKRRMVSGTFPSLPYVCHYDTIADTLHYCTKTQNETKELVGLGSTHPSDQQHLTEPSGQNQPVHGRSRAKLETCSRAAKRKTWPERRRERQQVKKIRREAQARREGGLLKRPCGNSDDEACHVDPFKSPCHGHCQATPPPQKRKMDEVGGKRSKKSREAERWKRRGGMKRGDLYPHVDIGSENLLSPKQRVRHRRR